MADPELVGLDDRVDRPRLQIDPVHQVGAGLRAQDRHPLQRCRAGGQLAVLQRLVGERIAVVGRALGEHDERQRAVGLDSGRLPVVQVDTHDLRPVSRALGHVQQVGSRRDRPAGETRAPVVGNPVLVDALGVAALQVDAPDARRPAAFRIVAAQRQPGAVARERGRTKVVDLDVQTFLRRQAHHLGPGPGILPAALRPVEGHGRHGGMVAG